MRDRALLPGWTVTLPCFPRPDLRARQAGMGSWAAAGYPLVQGEWDAAADVPAAHCSRNITVEEAQADFQRLPESLAPALGAAVLLALSS